MQMFLNVTVSLKMYTNNNKYFLSICQNKNKKKKDKEI